MEGLFIAAPQDGPDRALLFHLKEPLPSQTQCSRRKTSKCTKVCGEHNFSQSVRVGSDAGAQAVDTLGGDLAASSICNIYKSINMYLSLSLSPYIYIYIERERDTHIYIYIYTYIHTHILVCIHNI